MKKYKDFEFSFPLNETRIDLSRRDCKRIEHVGDLNIIGRAYYRPGTDEVYSADIDFVEWKGTDIKPVLRALDAMEEIQAAAVEHAQYLFNDENIPDEEPCTALDEMMGIVRVNNKIFYGI